MHVRHGSVTDLNRTESGTVTRGHVLVTSLGGVNSGQLSELFVHVVSTRTRVESKPDAKVLDLEWLFLVNLSIAEPSNEVLRVVIVMIEASISRRKGRGNLRR